MHEVVNNITLLDIMALVAIILLSSGIGAATWRSFDMLARLIPPRRGWWAWGTALVIAAAFYMSFVAADIPGVLSSIVRPGEHTTWPSVLRTCALGTWFWISAAIELMLARGVIGRHPVWRYGK